MPAKREPIGPTILHYVFAHKDDPAQTRCASRVATVLTDTHRRYMHAMREIQALVNAGKLTCSNVDGWAQVLGLP